VNRPCEPWRNTFAFRIVAAGKYTPEIRCRCKHVYSIAGESPATRRLTRHGKTVSVGIADGSGVKSPDLFDWARTAYEDIHESPRALLPVGAGGHVGDANQGPKQIDWVEVLSYVAVLDRALH
jgi:hypothetical protein